MKPLLHCCVLVAEDDAFEAQRLETTLSRLGAEVVLAADGDAALALMRRNAFDAALIDMVLPGLDGMGVLQALAAERIPTPVVAAVTAAGLERVPDALRAGARDFVVKPAGALRLQVALGNAMALARPVAQAPQPAAIATIESLAIRPAGMARAGGDSGFARLDGDGHVRPIAALEADAIRYACSVYRGRLGEVARRLGIGRSTLYRRVAALGVAGVNHNEHETVFSEPAALRIVAAE